MKERILCHCLMWDRSDDVPIYIRLKNRSIFLRVGGDARRAKFRFESADFACTFLGKVKNMVEAGINQDCRKIGLVVEFSGVMATLQQRERRLGSQPESPRRETYDLMLLDLYRKRRSPFFLALRAEEIPKLKASLEEILEECSSQASF